MIFKFFILKIHFLKIINELKNFIFILYTLNQEIKTNSEPKKNLVSTKIFVHIIENYERYTLFIFNFGEIL